MQFKFLRLLLVLTAILILSSCLDTTTTTTTTSSDASFVSLSLAGNDSAKIASFSLDADEKTIVNLDSLPFRTRIDSLYPTFSFKSALKAVLHFPKNRMIYKFSKGSDSIYITGKDTVDFRQALWTNKDSALWVNNYASDGIHNQIYKIKINIHKVHPELYIWRKVTDNVSTVNAVSQKAILLNDVFYYYLNDGSAAYLHTSTDGYSWSNSVTPIGLPEASPLNDMIKFNGKLYLTQDRLNIYSSSDGVNWTRKSVTNFNFKSLLYVFNGQLWAVVQSLNDATYHFATSTDGDVWNMIGTIPQNFPVNDFSAITITTVTGKSKVLVLGGYSTYGGLLKNSWSSEDGIYWVDFSTENHSLDSLAAGSSVILYDKKLLLFGKYNLSNTVFYRESKDEGLSWHVPDTVYNKIAFGTEYKSSKTYKDTVSYTDYYRPHFYQSALVDKTNRVFLIGGKTNNSSTSEVWTGKLNRKSFTRQ